MWALQFIHFEHVSGYRIGASGQSCKLPSSLFWSVSCLSAPQNVFDISVFIYTAHQKNQYTMNNRMKLLNGFISSPLCTWADPQRFVQKAATGWSGWAVSGVAASSLAVLCWSDGEMTRTHSQVLRYQRLDGGGASLTPVNTTLGGDWLDGFYSGCVKTHNEFLIWPLQSGTWHVSS